MEYGYGRCSKSSQDYDYELKLLLDKGIKRENIYLEYASGVKEDRIELNRLFNILGTGDSVYVTDITRLSRSTKHFCEIIDFVQKNKIRLVIGSLDVDCRKDSLDVMVEGMLKISAVFGEMERKMKIYQINLGLENAREKGKKLGRPNFRKENIPNYFYKYYIMYKDNNINKNELTKLCNISRPTLNKWLNFLK